MRRTARLGRGGRPGLRGAALVAGAAAAFGQGALGQQVGLTPSPPKLTRALSFDWPAIEIGAATYEMGPTGVTVFHFPKGVRLVTDVRGGAPGTVNTDLLRLGYSTRTWDNVVFSGGSFYGEEAIAGVMTAEKDQGLKSGDDLAAAVGAVIYDFQQHRLGDIYPDKALAAAALANRRAGLFPQGAEGAGRMAMQGLYLGCGAHSGQGAAFRQVGALKIAVFVVVNALGTVVDREGRAASCPGNPLWAPGTPIARLLAARRDAAPSAPAAGSTHNTTLSLVVVNRRMEPWALQRLAVQTHTSMARAIQPFSTEEDGDALFAADTDEAPEEAGGLTDLEVTSLASELMWDAVLASVPDDPRPPPPPRAALMAPSRLEGVYRFGATSTIEIFARDGALFARAHGPRFFDLSPGADVALTPTSATEFYVPGRTRSRLAFDLGPDGRAAGLVVNPGGWALVGRRDPAP